MIVLEKAIMTETVTNVLKRSLVVWIVIILAECVHGIARRLLLEPLVGDLRARQISVFIGGTIVVVITFVFVRWLKINRISHFILVGAFWVALTIGFEIVLGRFVVGLSWERIVSDYNIAGGGFMLFGLLVMLLAPLMMAKLVDEI